MRSGPEQGKIYRSARLILAAVRFQSRNAALAARALDQHVSGVRNRRGRSGESMLREQPLDTEPADTIAPPTADFDHLRTAFGHVAQGDNVARHGDAA